MSGFSSKTVCVVDNGLFCDVAATLAQSFGKVYLKTPWERTAPVSTERRVGEGLKDVEVVASIWPIAKKVDLWVFPDLNYGELQEYLAGEGHRVWGARTADVIETDRVLSRQILKKAGIKVPEYVVVKGVAALRDHLKDHPNRFVKIPFTRGDAETFHVENYALIEPRIDELEHLLGPEKHSMKFVVETPIEDAIELGYDCYCIDGAFPSRAMTGIEIKDRGYVGHVVDYDEIPEPLRTVNEKIAPVLKAYDYRQWWSCETRITKDGTPWAIDPCCRTSAPPGDSLSLAMYTNLAEIYWHGAEGELVEPEPAGAWGVELMLYSDLEAPAWQAVEFPAAIRDFVHLHYPVVLDRRYYVPPQGLPIIGGVCATGDTMEAAMALAQERADQVKGYGLSVHSDALEKAKSELEELEGFGYTL